MIGLFFSLAVLRHCCVEWRRCILVYAIETDVKD